MLVGDDPGARSTRTCQVGMGRKGPRLLLLFCFGGGSVGGNGRGRRQRRRRRRSIGGVFVSVRRRQTARPWPRQGPWQAPRALLEHKKQRIVGTRDDDGRRKRRRRRLRERRARARRPRRWPPVADARAEAASAAREEALEISSQLAEAREVTSRRETEHYAETKRAKAEARAREREEAAATAALRGRRPRLEVPPPPSPKTSSRSKTPRAELEVGRKDSRVIKRERTEMVEHLRGARGADAGGVGRKRERRRNEGEIFFFRFLDRERKTLKKLSKLLKQKSSKRKSSPGAPAPPATRTRWPPQAARSTLARAPAARKTAPRGPRRLSEMRTNLLPQRRRRRARRAEPS